MELIEALEKYKKNNKKEGWWGCVQNLYEEDKVVATPYLKEFRRELTQIVKADPSKELNAMLKSAYTLSALDSLDDFMIAMEWDRPNAEKFWLPRRSVLEGQHKLVSRLDAFIESPDDYKVAWSLPPGTGKSTIIKFLIAYICGKYPKSMNMYCSYSGAMSGLIYNAAVEMMTSDAYNFKNIVKGYEKPFLSADNKSISFRGKSDAATITMVSTEGSLTGRTRANKFLITDDLVKGTEVAMSPTQLEKLYYTYTQSICTRMEAGCKEIMLGTIWSLYDPISVEKQKHDGEKGYYFIAIPVEDEITHEPNFLYNHSSAYTRERIDFLKKKFDSVTFSCLYMQKGVEKEGLAFGIDRLKFFNGKLPDGNRKVMFHGDVAWGGGDSTSVPFAYVYDDGSVYIVDVLFDRGDKSITQPRLVGKILKNEANKGNIEANNGGNEYRDDIDRLLKAVPYSMSLTSFRAKRNMNKITRIEQHQQTIREFYFLSPELWDEDYRNFMNELTITSLTTKNFHDDAADSLAGLCEMIYTRDYSIGLLDKKFLFK